MTREALLLTQYERYGSVDRDDYIQMFIDEEFSIDESMVYEFNDFNMERDYIDDYIYDDLDEMLEGFSPTDVAFKVFNGKKFNPNDQFFQFDGYGNLKSFDESDIIELMEDDKDFQVWYISRHELINWEKADKIIEEANELIIAGY